MRCALGGRGLVTSALTHAGQAAPHIPYRGSTLTRILEPSLGGNARTAVICMITLAPEHAEESLATLVFATRAMKVRL